MRGLSRAALLLRSAANAYAPVTEALVAERPLSRLYSRLPAEYEKYYDAAQPIRRAGAAASGAVEGASSPALPASSAEGAAGLEQQRESAAAVSRWMFPWEKRQMSGEQGPLRTWERFYWFAFVGGLALLLFNRLPGQAKEPVDPEVEREKEQRKLKAARLLLAGQGGGEDEEDEFEGLSPQEIQAYVDKALGANAAADPFDGMSPEEINAMLEAKPN